MIGTAFLPDATSALQTLLAVSVLIAIVLVARRHVARYFGAGVAYALWAIPVARLVLPPLQMPISLMPFLKWPGSTAGAVDRLPVTNVASVTTESVSTAVTIAPSAPHIVRPGPLPDTMPESLTSPESLMDTAAALFLPGLFLLWAGGALFFFGFSLWRQHVFMQTVRREAVNVSPRMQMIARQVGAQVGLKRLPVIASSFISSGPLVTGLARPVVLLPAWFETDYDDVQQRAALAHELTHVRRGDLWALQIAELFVAVLWFNPLAWYARRAFRTDQEAACDADVLKTGTASPHAYGATLIKAVKSASQERLPAAAGLPLTHALKERLSRMTHPEPTRSRRLLGGAAAAVLGVAALAATSSVTANAEEDKRVEKRVELRIDNGTVYVNGKKIQDRQIVVLGEPFAGIEPDTKFNEEIARLSAEMAEEGSRIAQVTAEITTRAGHFTFSPEDDAEFRALMDQLNDLPLTVDFQDGLTLEFDGEMTEEDWEAWGEKWAEWGEQIGERTEAWADAYEQRADRISEMADAHAERVERELEPKLEKMTLELEKRMEEKSARLEALVEQSYGEDFERRIEATSDALDDLVDECRDADLADGETRVLTRTVTAGGKKNEVKIACVKGDATALRSASALAVINHDPGLCKDEKKSFRDQVGDAGELDGAEN